MLTCCVAPACNRMVRSAMRASGRDEATMRTLNPASTVSVPAWIRIGMLTVAPGLASSATRIRNCPVFDTVACMA